MFLLYRTWIPKKAFASREHILKGIDKHNNYNKASIPKFWVQLYASFSSNSIVSTAILDSSDANLSFLLAYIHVYLRLFLFLIAIVYEQSIYYFFEHAFTRPFKVPKPLQNYSSSCKLQLTEPEQNIFHYVSPNGQHLTQGLKSWSMLIHSDCFILDFWVLGVKHTLISVVANTRIILLLCLAFWLTPSPFGPKHVNMYK